MEKDRLTELERRALEIWDSEDDPREHMHEIKGALYHPPEKGGFWKLLKLFQSQDP